jgi:hypothetical protein
LTWADKEKVLNIIAATSMAINTNHRGLAIIRIANPNEETR